MSFLRKISLIYGGFIFSVFTFLMFGIISAIFYDNNFSFYNKSNKMKDYSAVEQVDMNFSSGKFRGVYKFSRKGSDQMYIDYSGYFMKFFSNYIIWFSATNRNEQDIRVRYDVKTFKLYVENDIQVLEMDNPALKIDNEILRKGMFLYYE